MCFYGSIMYSDGISPDAYDERALSYDVEKLMFFSLIQFTVREEGGSFCTARSDPLRLLSRQLIEVHIGFYWKCTLHCERER